jgi:hypothetical protein
LVAGVERAAGEGGGAAAGDGAGEGAGDQVFAGDAAVVRGAMGSWLSLLAATVSFQPSGVVTTPGSAEATRPLSGGGPSAAGSAGGGGGGSAAARGATATGANRATAARVARRFNMRELVPLVGVETGQGSVDVIGVVGGGV